MMRMIRKLVSVDTLILIGCFLSFYQGVRMHSKKPLSMEDLVRHRGVVTKTDIHFKSSGDVFRLTLRNNRLFTTPTEPRFLSNVIWIGDSVEVYTATWDTVEILHLVSARYPNPLIDFEENKKVDSAPWFFYVVGIALFIWFMNREAVSKRRAVDTGSWDGL